MGLVKIMENDFRAGEKEFGMLHPCNNHIDVAHVPSFVSDLHEDLDLAVQTIQDGEDDRHATVLCY